MSYLGRAAARAGTEASTRPAAQGASGSLVPTMFIESPLVQADQRLGMPDFAGPALVHAAAEAPTHDRPVPLAESLAEAPTLAAESSTLAPASRERPRSRALSPATPAVVRSAFGGPPGQVIPSVPAPSGEAPLRGAVEGVRAPSPSVTKETAAPQGTNAMPARSTPARTSSALPDNLFAALAQVSAWVAPRGASAQREDDFAAADAVLGSAAGHATPPARVAIEPRTASSPDATAPMIGVPGEPTNAFEPRRAQAEIAPRLEARGRAESARAAHIEPSPLVKPMAARAPAFEAPVIRIGKIDVEVVPPPTLQERRAPAPRARPTPASRSPHGIGEPPPFGWRQR
jgi:hypothetical protein